VSSAIPQHSLANYINTFYDNTTTNSMVSGVNSLAGNVAIGGTQYPLVAKRRTIIAHNLKSVLSYPVACAVVEALVGGIISLIPVYFNNPNRTDGGILYIVNRDGSGKDEQKIGFHIAAEGRIEFYSPKFQTPLTPTALIHAPLLMLACAYLYPKSYSDVCDAVETTLKAIKTAGGLKPRDALQLQHIVKLADELMFALAYGPNATVQSEKPNSKPDIQLYGDYPPQEIKLATPEVPPEAFVNVNEFEKLRRNLLKHSFKATSKVESPTETRPKITTEFVGPLAVELADATMRGWHSLLTGPTETGKTLAVESICDSLEAPLILVKGSEGLKDRDIIGALKLIDGNSVFVKGPLPRALEAGRKQYEAQLKENKKAAEAEKKSKGKKKKRIVPKKVPPAVLYVDEINRMETRHQNMILVTLNQRYKTKDYYLYIPDTGEEVTCPVGFFVIIAARNFGSYYVGTNATDLATIRRFHMKFDVTYLPRDAETKLVINQTGIEDTFAEVLTRTAESTRSQAEDLEAPLGTGSVIVWAQQLQHMKNLGKSLTLRLLMDTAAQCWFEMVAGRDPWGALDTTKREILESDIRRAWNEIFHTRGEFY